MSSALSDTSSTSSIASGHVLADRLAALLAADPALPALDAGCRERLVAWVQLLSKWNRVWNLTAVRDPALMLERHVLDSLSLLPFIDAALDRAVDRRADTVIDAPPCPAGTVDLLDIGSGAGLPVLPLAIARPALRCLSIERTDKKARFQRQAVLELGLHAVEVRNVRIETLEQRAAIVTSRAFTAPETFLQLAARHVMPRGRALVMLGRAERLPTHLPAPFELERLQRIVAHRERHVAVCVATS